LFGCTLKILKSNLSGYRDAPATTNWGRGLLQALALNYHALW